eukprot:713811-Ditylum_brightwellii.AAC.1
MARTTAQSNVNTKRKRNKNEAKRDKTTQQNTAKRDKTTQRNNATKQCDKTQRHDALDRQHACKVHI